MDIRRLQRKAKIQILAPTFEDVVRFEKGTVDDDMSIILDTDRFSAIQTREFSKNFKPTKSGMHDLWKFLKKEIRYKEDPAGHEQIKSPSRLYYDKVGDCKSFSIFVGSVLQNLNIPYRYKLVKWKKEEGFRHIYVVAELPDETVIMDATHRLFDFEDTYAVARYYNPKETGFQIGSLESTQQPSIAKLLLGVAAGIIIFKSLT